MRPVIIWLLLAVAVADSKVKRDAHDEGPYEEHVRVKRGHEKHRRSTDLPRRPRQVHQYEVHEFTDDVQAHPPSYEQMLAASAIHFPKVYAPAPRHLRPEANIAEFVVSEPLQFVAEAPVAASLTVPNEDPVPIPAEPVQSLQKLAEGDLVSAASGHHSKHGHEHGGGHEKHGSHHGSHGGKSSNGYNSDHWLDKGNKGYKTDELHRKEYEEQDGKRKKYHDNAGHKGSHEEEAFGQRGSHFDAKKGHKKGHKSRGFHNKYHKDEFQKEHKFYDDFHKSGDHHRYGKFNARHKSNESGKKKAHHVNAGHDYVESGKKGYSHKGHVDADHKGYHGKHGHDDHHNHHEAHGKKGGKEGGSHWGYNKKH